MRTISLACSPRFTSASQSDRSGGGGLDPEVRQDLVVHALGANVERHLVDRVDVARGHHRRDRQVREQGDLLADVAVERAPRSGT